MKPIAVIGLSCLFPEADTPKQFWENLLQDKNSCTTATEENLQADPLRYSTDKKGRVLRTWANKYRPFTSETGVEVNKHGDEVTESVHWPPTIGQPSKRKIGGSRDFIWS